MEPVRPDCNRRGSWGAAAAGGGCWGTGDSYSRQQSPWQVLGRCHLAGLRLGGSGGCFVITQRVLATAERGEHAVPELEGKGRESGAGLVQSVCSKLGWSAKWAYSPFPLWPLQPSLLCHIWLSGENLLNTCDPTPVRPGTKSKGAFSLMTFHDAFWVPRAICKLSHLTQEFGILPFLWMKN